MDALPADSCAGVASYCSFQIAAYDISCAAGQKVLLKFDCLRVGRAIGLPDDEVGFCAVLVEEDWTWVGPTSG